VVVALVGLAPAAAATKAEETGGQRRRGGIRAGHQAARDHAGPDHAGGARTCCLPRSRRAQREPLRAGGLPAAHRTCAEPARGLPAGAATTGVPTTARWMTATPAARQARKEMPRAGHAMGTNPARCSGRDGKTGGCRDANDARASLTSRYAAVPEFRQGRKQMAVSHTLAPADYAPAAPAVDRAANALTGKRPMALARRIAQATAAPRPLARVTHETSLMRRRVFPASVAGAVGARRCGRDDDLLARDTIPPSRPRQ